MLWRKIRKENGDAGGQGRRLLFFFFFIRQFFICIYLLIFTYSFLAALGFHCCAKGFL